MFAPSKILFLILTLLVVWWLWRLFERKGMGVGGQSKTSSGDAVDLVQCPSCGDWVEGACGKPECAGPGPRD